MLPPKAMSKTTAKQTPLRKYFLKLFLVIIWKKQSAVFTKVAPNSVANFHIPTKKDLHPDHWG